MIFCHVRAPPPYTSPNGNDGLHFELAPSAGAAVLPALLAGVAVGDAAGWESAPCLRAGARHSHSPCLVAGPPPPPGGGGGTAGWEGLAAHAAESGSPPALAADVLVRLGDIILHHVSRLLASRLARGREALALPPPGRGGAGAAVLPLLLAGVAVGDAAGTAGWEGPAAHAAESMRGPWRTCA